MLKKVREITCPYCGKLANLVTGEEIYPNMPQLWRNYYYSCKPCGAYVGIHKRESDIYFEPLGTLANAETGKARLAAHVHVDKIWKLTKKLIKRGEVYSWLAKSMNLESKDCHIAMFNVEQCKIATELAKKKMRQLMVNGFKDGIGE